MKKNKNKITWQDVKNILIEKDSKELLKLARDLYSLNDQKSMFDKVLKILKKLDQKTNDEYFPRLLDLVNQVSGIGWGHYDYLITELEEAFPEKF